MSTPFLGEIRILPYGRGAPTGWLVCDGSLQSIAQNDALYTLIGTTYGGDGVNTFGLPDLRGRVPVHQGTGIGLSTYTLGQTGGVETVTLLQTQMGAHNHAPVASTATATAATAGGNVLAAVGGNASGDGFYVPSGGGGTSATLPGPGATLQTTSGGAPHDNTAPTLVLQYCIATEGVFPPRG